MLTGRWEGLQCLYGCLVVAYNNVQIFWLQAFVYQRVTQCPDLYLLKPFRLNGHKEEHKIALQRLLKHSY